MSTSPANEGCAPKRRVPTLARDSNLEVRRFHEKSLESDWQERSSDGEWSGDFTFPGPQSFKNISSRLYKRIEEDFEDWKLVLSAKSANGFFGQLFFQPVKWQMALAFKGTKTKWDVVSDVWNVFMKEGGLQVDSAFTFAEEVRRLINRFKTKPQLFITGHSLGGYLAQVATFTIRNFCLAEDGEARVLSEEQDFGLNTVVFDAPAAFKQMLQIAKSVWDPLNERCLDLPIKNFVVDTNLINCNSVVGPHVGAVIVLRNAEELGKPSRYRRFTNVLSLHSLKNFEGVDLSTANLAKHFPSGSIEEFDPNRVSLMQFSPKERNGLRLIPLSTTATNVGHRNVLPDYQIVEDQIAVTDDTKPEEYVIPALRFFLKANKAALSNLGAELTKEFSDMMIDLLSAQSRDFNDMDLQLKPAIKEKIEEMLSGTRIVGFEKEREELLFAKTLSNTIGALSFAKFDDFVGGDEARWKTWLRLNVGTLVLCQADRRSIDVPRISQTKVLYLDGGTYRYPVSPNLSDTIEMSLTVSDLDAESKERLKKRKIHFRGNNVDAEKVFLDLFGDLKVLDVIDFTWELRDAKNDFHFHQRILNGNANVAKRYLNFTYLVNCVQMSSSVLQTIMISCNAGMGKTTNLKKVAKVIQDHFPHYCVVRLELASCSQSLRKWSGRSEHGCSQYNALRETGGLLDFLPQRPQVNSTLLQQQPRSVEDATTLVAEEMLKGTTDNNGALKTKIYFAKIAAKQVIFLLDAVDEVCPLYRDETIKLLQLLRQTGLKMLVATRPQEEEEVAAALAIEREQILRLDTISQRNQPVFIQKFWASRGIPSDMTTAKALVEKLTENLPDEMPGIPLNLSMIAELFPDGELSVDFKQHGDLYLALFEMSIGKAVKEKLGQDANNAIQRASHIQMTRRYFTLLQRVATTEWFHEGNSLEEEDVEFINRLPFVVIVGQEARFAHQTFQEYLIAVQLVRVLNGDRNETEVFLTLDKVEALLTNDECRQIRVSADTIFSHTDCSVISAERFYVKALEYICLEEQHLNIFQLLIANRFSYNCRLEPNGIHPLELVLSNRMPKGVFVEFLMSRGSRLEDAVNEENRCEMLRGAIRAGLKELIVEKWDHLFRAAINSFKFSPLVTAVECRNIDLLRFLIEKGADVDRPELGGHEYDSITPLSVAIENEDTEMVQLLVDHQARVDFHDFLQGNHSCLEILGTRINSINVKDVNGRSVLMRAASKGNSDCVRYLLDNGVDPCGKDRDGRSALNYAIEKDSKESFEILFNRTVPAQDEKNKLLIDAAEKNAREVISFLLENGADPNAVDNDGNTVLHIAALTPNGCMELLLESYLNLFDIEARNERGETPLHVAAAHDYGDLSCVEMLLAKGADANAVDDERWTPLHHAASKVRDDNCSTLLKHRVPVDARDRMRLTPLMVAAKSIDAVDVVTLLLENGADPGLVDNAWWNCLHHAAKAGNENIIDELWDKVPSDSSSQGGLTPLMVAAGGDESGNAVDVLLEKGADVSRQDQEGWNCLHHAAANGCERNVATLREHVPLDSVTSEGQTAFQLAVQNGFQLMALKLLEEGDSFGVQDILEKAIRVNKIEIVRIYVEGRQRVEAKEFLMAAESGHLDILEIFLPLVESVDVMDEDGKTALMVALKENHEDCVVFLLENGADLCLQDEEGNSCLEHAVWASDDIELLLSLVPEESRNLERLLHLSIQAGRVETFLFLLENGADLDVLDADDNTCLHLAAQSPECFEHLLQNHLHQFDLNVRNQRHETPLHCAAKHAGVAHLQLLMLNGADAKAKECRGRTTLHFAAELGRLENCEVLSPFVPVDSKDCDRRTPLMLAAESGEALAPRVVEFLLDRGADPELKDDAGRNSLHLAVKRGRLENVEILSQHVPLDSRTRYGVTALQIA